MSITTLSFIAFAFVVFIAYYIIPRRLQWCLLLVASLFFYMSFSAKNIIYVLLTATTIFFATCGMSRISNKQKSFFKSNPNLTKEEKKIIKLKNHRKRKAIMVVTLLINLGVLCTFKYSDFTIEQINGVCSWFGLSQPIKPLHLIAPLGISFYTFQSIGYLVDIYWEHYEAEKNYFKTLLFVSFFPQITQGPISDFSQLSKELFAEHRFDYKNFSYGFQRVVWGFFKKTLIADVLAPFVSNVFANYADYDGFTVLLGAFLYSIRIYADFSGYMDIMCGFCQMLDIKLTENFLRPYFSKSIAEYWRRWHISLGDWFKKYIYFPIGMSSFCRRFAKNNKERFSKHFCDTLPATVALLATWLATGFWHGASWRYITWGLVNGFFIILSLWLEPLFVKCKSALKINESAFCWRAFQTVRTFFLVTLIKVFPEVGDFSSGFAFILRIFTGFSSRPDPGSLFALGKLSMLETITFFIMIVCVILLFFSSLLQRKQPLRTYFNKFPPFLRIFILAISVIIIIAFGIPASWGGGGFMYANF